MFPSSYHHEIFRSDNQWQKQYSCKRSGSKVKVTEVKTQFSCFRTVTAVWIHIWQWNDAQSLMWLRRGALLFFKAIVKFEGHTGQKMSNLTQIRCFRTVTPVWIHQWLWNDAQSLELHRRGAQSFFTVIRQISSSHRAKKIRFWPKLRVSRL